MNSWQSDPIPWNLTPLGIPQEWGSAPLEITDAWFRQYRKNTLEVLPSVYSGTAIGSGKLLKVLPFVYSGTVLSPARPLR